MFVHRFSCRVNAKGRVLVFYLKIPPCLSLWPPSRRVIEVFLPVLLFSDRLSPGTLIYFDITQNASASLQQGLMGVRKYEKFEWLSVLHVCYARSLFQRALNILAFTITFREHSLIANLILRQFAVMETPDHILSLRSIGRVDILLIIGY